MILNCPAPMCLAILVVNEVFAVTPPGFHNARLTHYSEDRARFVCDYPIEEAEAIKNECRSRLQGSGYSVYLDDGLRIVKKKGV